MSDEPERLVRLSEVQAAIDETMEQILSEDMFGASREMVAEGTAKRIKGQVNDLAE